VTGITRFHSSRPAARWSRTWGGGRCAPAAQLGHGPPSWEVDGQVHPQLHGWRSCRAVIDAEGFALEHVGFPLEAAE
jgi:hypothetical protein